MDHKRTTTMSSTCKMKAKGTELSPWSKTAPTYFDRVLKGLKTSLSRKNKTIATESANTKQTNTITIRKILVRGSTQLLVNQKEVELAMQICKQNKLSLSISAIEVYIALNKPTQINLPISKITLL